MDTLNALFRWLHILAGIVWIGMLYFFNWVNGPFAATMDGETKKKVVPELMPRALFWFRWGAAWTWVTGVLLLLLVFYHGGIMFDGERGWSAGRDRHGRVRLPGALRLRRAPEERARQGSQDVRSAWPSSWSRSWSLPHGRRGRASATARSTSTSAALFGTIMAFNVWFRIWPAQQKIITAVKAGTAPDARAGGPGGHALAPQHLHVGAARLDDDQPAHDDRADGSSASRRRTPSLLPLIVILVGWHIVWQLYKSAPKVKGF